MDRKKKKSRFFANNPNLIQGYSENFCKEQILEHQARGLKDDVQFKHEVIPMLQQQNMTIDQYVQFQNSRLSVIPAKHEWMSKFEKEKREKELFNYNKPDYLNQDNYNFVESKVMSARNPFSRDCLQRPATLDVAAEVSKTMKYKRALVDPHGSGNFYPAETTSSDYNPTSKILSSQQTLRDKKFSPKIDYEKEQNESDDDQFKKVQKQRLDQQVERADVCTEVEAIKQVLEGVKQVHPKVKIASAIQTQDQIFKQYKTKQQILRQQIEKFHKIDQNQYPAIGHLQENDELVQKENKKTANTHLMGEGEMKKALPIEVQVSRLGQNCLSENNGLQNIYIRDMKQLSSRNVQEHRLMKEIYKTVYHQNTIKSKPMTSHLSPRSFNHRRQTVPAPITHPKCCSAGTTLSHEKISNLTRDTESRSNTFSQMKGWQTKPACMKLKSSEMTRRIPSICERHMPETIKDQIYGPHARPHALTKQEFRGNVLATCPRVPIKGLVQDKGQIAEFSKETHDIAVDCNSMNKQLSEDSLISGSIGSKGPSVNIISTNPQTQERSVERKSISVNNKQESTQTLNKSLQIEELNEAPTPRMHNSSLCELATVEAKKTPVKKQKVISIIDYRRISQFNRDKAQEISDIAKEWALDNINKSPRLYQQHQLSPRFREQKRQTYQTARVEIGNYDNWQQKKEHPIHQFKNNPKLVAGQIKRLQLQSRGEKGNLQCIQIGGESTPQINQL